MTPPRISSSETVVSHVPAAETVAASSVRQNTSPPQAPNLAREVSEALQLNTQNLWRRLNGQRALVRETPVARAEPDAAQVAQARSVEQAVDQSISGINLQGRSRLNQTQINSLLEGAARLASVGKRERVDQLLGRLQTEIATWNNPWALASAERAIAGIYAQVGDHEKALQHLERVSDYVSENPSVNNRGRGARFCSAEDQPRLAQLASILPILRSLYRSEQTPQNIESALSRLRAKVEAHPENALAVELRDQLQGNLRLARQGVLVGVVQTVLSEWAQKEVLENHASQETLNTQISAYLEAVAQRLQQHSDETLSQALSIVAEDPSLASRFLNLRHFLRSGGYSAEENSQSVQQLLSAFVAANQDAVAVSEGEMDANLYDFALRLSDLDRNYTQSALQFAGLLEQRRNLGSRPSELKNRIELKAQSNAIFGELRNFVPGLGHNVLQTYSHFLIPFALGRGLSVVTKSFGVARLGSLLGFLLPCAAEAAGFTLAGTGVSGVSALYQSRTDNLHRDALQNFWRNEATGYNLKKGFGSMLITFVTCHGWGAAFKALARPARTLFFGAVENTVARAVGNRSSLALDYLLTGPGSFYASGAVNQFMGLEEHQEKPSWALGFLGNVIEDLKMKAGGRVIEGHPAARQWMHSVEQRHHLMGEARRLQSILREYNLHPFSEKGLQFTQLLLSMERRTPSAARGDVTREGLWHAIMGEVDLSRRVNHEELAREVREAMNNHERNLREILQLRDNALNSPVYRQASGTVPTNFDARALSLAAFVYEGTRQLNAQSLMMSIADLNLNVSDRVQLLQNSLELGVQAQTLSGIKSLSDGNVAQLHFYIEPFLKRDVPNIGHVIEEVREFEGRQDSARDVVDTQGDSVVSSNLRRDPVSAIENTTSNGSSVVTPVFAGVANANVGAERSDALGVRPQTVDQVTGAHPSKDRRTGAAAPLQESNALSVSSLRSNPRASHPSAENFGIESSIIFNSPVETERPENLIARSQTLQPVTGAKTDASVQAVVAQQAVVANVRGVEGFRTLRQRQMEEAARLEVQLLERIHAKDNAGEGASKDDSHGFSESGYDANNPLRLNTNNIEVSAAELLAATKNNPPQGNFAQLTLEVPGVGSRARVEEGVEGLQAAGRSKRAAANTPLTQDPIAQKLVRLLHKPTAENNPLWRQHFAQVKTEAQKTALREALVGIQDANLNATQRELFFDRLQELQQLLNPSLEILTNPNMSKVFIPNRGEIALRIARTLHDQGLTPVLMVHQSERNSSWVKLAKEKYKAEAYVCVRLELQTEKTKGSQALVKEILESDGSRALVIAPTRDKLSPELQAELDALNGLGAIHLYSETAVTTDPELIAQTYMNPEMIALAAALSRCEALHPGYGYKSEAPELVSALSSRDITLLGPSLLSMKRAGDKDIAKQAFIEAGIPVVEGTKVGHPNAVDLCHEMLDLGFFNESDRPLVLQALQQHAASQSFSDVALRFSARLKAVGGGGGKGQRTVHTLSSMLKEFPACLSEGKSEKVLAERFIPRFQHVEFQIMCDRFGNVVICGERECTLQEGDQKLIEIYPAEIFNRFEGLSDKMREAVRKAARAVNYTGHGTVEFMVNPDTGEFYAMEVNARIQVEHRVTESSARLVAQGKRRELDLVRDAIDVGRGLPLSYSQEHLQNHGAAIEIRLKGVDSTRLIMGRSIPTAGEVTRFEVPKQEGVYLETSIRGGDSISPFFDAMVAKLVVYHPEGRLAAIEKAIHVLKSVQFESNTAKTDLPRLLRWLQREATRCAEYDNTTVGKAVKIGIGDKALRSNKPIALEEFENRADYRYSDTLELQSSSPAKLVLERVGNMPLPKDKLTQLAERFNRTITLLLQPSHGQIKNQITQTTLARFLRENNAFRQALHNWATQSDYQLTFQVNSVGDLKQVRALNQKTGEQICYVGSDPLSGLAAAEVVYEIKNNVNDPAFTPPSISYYSAGFHQSYLQSKPQSLQVNRSGQFAWHYSLSEGQPTQANLKLTFELQEGVARWSIENISRVRIYSQNTVTSTPHLALEIFETFNRALDQSDRNTALQQLGDLLHRISNTFSPRHQTDFIKQVMTLPLSLTAPLTALLNNPTLSLAARQLAHEIQTRREFRQKNLDVIEVDEHNHLIADFHELLGHNGEARKVRRSFARVHTTNEGAYEVLQSWASKLNERNANCSDCGPHAIELMMPKPNAFEAETWRKQFQSTLNQNPEWTQQSHVRRITVAFVEGDAYPEYHTFERAALEGGALSNEFVENANIRHLQPFTANHLIEIDRLKHFDLSRDTANSGADFHLYYGRGREKFSNDSRAFGHLVVRRAQVEKNPKGGNSIPQLEMLFGQALQSMQKSLKENPKSDANWNRLFLNILPELNLSHDEAVTYIRSLAEANWESLKALHLEKVVVRGRIRLNDASNNFKEVLITVTNPTRHHFEVKVRAITDVVVQVTEHTVDRRQALVEWSHLKQFEDLFSKPESNIAGADLTLPFSLLHDAKVSPASPLELRKRQELSAGRLWAYDVPQIVAMGARLFREKFKLPSSSGIKEGFIELDFSDDVRTQAYDIDYDKVPALHEQHRAEGLNDAGVVIGVQNLDLGIGQAAKRVLIIGDWSNGKGALTSKECARIVAALRYADEHRLPVDWFPLSSGAEIHINRGVDGLDATSQVVAELLQRCVHRRRNKLPINIVVNGINIGAQSYWNAVSTILERSRGNLIMVEGKASMALTGPLALASAFFPNFGEKELKAKMDEMFPNGLQSLAGFKEVHGPNGDAMLGVANFSQGLEALLAHYYLSYAPNGRLARRRNDSVSAATAPITLADIQSINPKSSPAKPSMFKLQDALLRKIADPNLPFVDWYRAYDGLAGLDPKDLVQKLMQQSKTLVREMQIGGRACLTVFYPSNGISVSDSKIIARALRKAHRTMPVLVLGSPAAFKADRASMQHSQLEGGSRLASAFTEHEGPLVVLNLGNMQGGFWVVQSKRMNPNIRMLALKSEGFESTARVVNGPMAAATAFKSTISKTAEKIVAEAVRRSSYRSSASSEEFAAYKAAIRQGLEAFDITLNQKQSEARRRNISEQSYNDLENFSEDKAAELPAFTRKVVEDLYSRIFEANHDITNASEVGAVDRVLGLENLRENLIEEIEGSVRRYGEFEVERKRRKDQKAVARVNKALSNGKLNASEVLATLVQSASVYAGENRGGAAAALKASLLTALAQVEEAERNGDE